MNSFGRLFRVNIFGESHGECIGVLLDGVPAGLKLVEEDFTKDLLRRNPELKGTTPRKECDIPFLESGILNNKTTGAPVLILFENRDVDSKKYETLKFTPRPGHADFTAYTKFSGYNDYRGGGHFSGRITTGLVAAGVVAKKLLKGVRIDAELISAGSAGGSIEKNISIALKDGDSVGGVIECKVNGLKFGLGEPFFDSVESLLSHALFAVPGVKGVEFGLGFAAAKTYGSKCNDVLINADGKTKTNNSGGINGGITNGNELYFKVAVKPTSSIAKEQETVDLKTGKKTKIKIEGRHDVCFALRVPVIIEAVTAMVLADLMMLEQKIPRVVK